MKIAEERVSLDEIEKTVLGRYDFHTVTLAVTLKGRQAIGIAVDQSRSPEYDPTRVRQYERELRKLLKPAAVRGSGALSPFCRRIRRARPIWMQYEAYLKKP